MSGPGGVLPPAPVVLDDLAAPRFTPEIEALRAGLVDVAPLCPLDPAALCAAAVDQTGLDDFGAEDFRPRLDVLCRSLVEEGGLGATGVVSWYTQLVQFLRNRLLLQELLTRHPEIRDVEVVAPIVIAGLPRTGTTHLHNLLGADPALRSLPYWESLEPVLPEAERPGPGQDDPRHDRCRFGLEVMGQAMPHFDRMHEMTVDHVHEEIQLMALDVSTMFFETQALLPGWRDHYRSTDQTSTYRYLRTVLQALQWLRGGTRWVLKSPQHLEQFGPLLAAFPDATVVVTHRDPAAVTVSMATMVAYSARMVTDRPDPRAIGSYWSERVGDLFLACAADRDLLPDDRTVDVHFDRFMADDLGTVERIYDVAGQPFTEDSRRAMAAFAAAHPRGRFGGVVYRPDVLGIDPAERRRALAPYVDRFGVTLEG